jgi:PhnB protein
MPGDGRIGHATIRVDGAEVMLADEFPESVAATGTLAPATLGGTTALVHLRVDDVDAWWARAVGAGATALCAPRDEFFGRQGKLRDPFGHVWSLNGPRKG